MGTAVLNTKSVSALKSTLRVYVKAGREVNASQLLMEKDQVLSQRRSGCYFTLAPTVGRAGE